MVVLLLAPCQARESQLERSSPCTAAHACRRYYLYFVHIQPLYNVVSSDGCGSALDSNTI